MKDSRLKRERGRSGKPLKRRAGSRRELKTIVVFCEGKNTEPDYVGGLKRLPQVQDSTALNIEIHPEQGTPLTLVEMAVGRITEPEVDECWCLFDVEWPQNHPNLNAAVALADANGVQLAISNPCFELWLILHYQDHTRFENTSAVEKASRQLDRRKGKTIDASVYMPLRQAAGRRAAALDRRHAKDGNVFPNNNPSSGMHRFLEAVEGS
ncbi:RloB family protein [Actinoplanes sp. TRM 88003]|uniref:RloB family protein n=1 Tax=Paractinoplanes aksuensis TaxID=2939490 RepID=A0ABT1E129_9ACTN|nr:RloB domain-containing protein [Actinoplanes aksuensis]MCO8276824.1 RloB family protein [Actinoplanes aksuensis]